MACKNLMIRWYSYIPQAMPRKQDTDLWFKLYPQVVCEHLYEFFEPINCRRNYFYFEINRIWLLPRRLLPRIHLARSCLNGLHKPYDPMVFPHTAGDANKARHHLARMTETCNQLMSPHVKCKSDLLPTGHIWPYEPSYKLIANSHRISHLIPDFRYSYSLTGFSTI